MDEARQQERETQLGLWRAKIDGLAARTLLTNVQAGFDAHMYLDELKVLHAIAQAKFDELRAAGARQRPRLEAEVKVAWKDLESALGNPTRPR